MYDVIIISRKYFKGYMGTLAQNLFCGKKTLMGADPFLIFLYLHFGNRKEVKHFIKGYDLHS